MGVLGIFCGILWGRISDGMGRSQAFGLSFIILGVGFVLFWLTPTLTAFVFASILIGLTMRAAYTLCAAGSGDHVPAYYAATAFALIAVWAGLGSSAAPIIAGAIADTVGISWVFALGLGASLIGAAGSVFLRPASPVLQPVAFAPAD